MKTLFSSLTLLFFFAFAMPGYSQPKTPTGTIKGKVIDQTTKEPIPGAIIEISSLQIGSSTDTAGVFIIKDVPEGEYSLNVTVTGYQSKTVDHVEVVRDKTYYAEFGLIVDQVQLSEATVTDYRDENNPKMLVSSYSFSREEIFRNPGAQGDVFRAIGVLPGVTSSGAQYSAIAVRGEGTSDNVYMVDDMPMFDLSHLQAEGFNAGFNDPNGGRFSIFAPRIIDNATFQAGGFDAEYGRKSSSYLALGIKDGNLETPSVSGQFDLLGFTLIYDGPSGIDKNTSVFASARYQNFTLLEQVVGLTYAGIPAYGDYILKTTSQLGSKNKLSFIAMYDPETYNRNVSDVAKSKNLDNENSSNFVGNTVTNKGIVGLNLQTLTSHTSLWRNVLYYRFSNVDNSLGISFPEVDASGDILNTSNIPADGDLRHITDDQQEVGYRSIFTQHIDKTTITAGIDAARVQLNYSRILQHTDTLYTFSDLDYRPSPTQYYLVLPPSEFNSNFNNFAYNASGYVNVSFTLFKRLILNSGVRYDYTGFASQGTVSPRFSGSFVLDDRESINFAAGTYYEDPDYTDIGGQPAGHTLKEQQENQAILGYKRNFAKDLKLVAEGWYKQFNDLVVQPATGESYLNNDGTGYAYGGDISLTKRLSKNYYGEVGYSYMVSKRDNHDGEGVYDYIFSQPNVASILGSWQPNKKWILSGKFRYSTGRPTDKYIVHANVFNDPSVYRYSQEIIGHNEDRLPDFVSLDIRADYKIQKKKTAITFFVDIVDILNRFNVNEAIFQPLTGQTYPLGLAIFPSFGLRLER